MRANASQVLANGLRTEFWDTYAAVNNRVADSRLSQVMNLSVGADNRDHDFGYFESSPHFDLWKRGGEIKSKAMDSVSFNVPVYEWGRRVPWLKWDKDDDRTDSLMDVARQAGASAAKLPERMFFDLIQNQTTILPAVPTAPDGAAMFATTDAGGSNRFGVALGNLLSGTAGVNAANILTDFYGAIEQFMLFEDTEGQPLLGDDLMRQPFVIIHPVASTNAFEEAFLQKQQDGGSQASVSNVVADTAKRVTLWPSPRLDSVDTRDWYIFLGAPPKEPTFFLDREGVQEQTSLMEDNNSDLTRKSAEESIQWYSRSGAGIALPYGAIKVTVAS